MAIWSCWHEAWYGEQATESPNGLTAEQACSPPSWQGFPFLLRYILPVPTARGILHSVGCSSLTNWQEQTGLG